MQIICPSPFIALVFESAATVQVETWPELPAIKKFVKQNASLKRAEFHFCLEFELLQWKEVPFWSSDTFRYSTSAPGEYQTSLCESLDVTLAREDWDDSRAHRLIQWRWSGVSQLRGNLVGTSNSKSEGQGWESSDVTLVSGWPGLGWG